MAALNAIKLDEQAVSKTNEGPLKSNVYDIPLASRNLEGTIMFNIDISLLLLMSA